MAKLQSWLWLLFWLFVVATLGGLRLLGLRRPSRQHLETIDR